MRCSPSARHVGLIAVLPLLRKVRGIGLSVAISLAAALVAGRGGGVAAGIQRHGAERLNLRYVERDGKAWWVADPVQHLPDRLRAAANFSESVQHLPVTGYVAPAGTAQFPRRTPV